MKIGSALLFLLLVVVGSCSGPADACPQLESRAGTRADASEALMDCVRRAPAGGRLDLEPGEYRLRRPLAIDKPVTIATRGLGNSSGCAELPAGSCAVLLLDPAARWAEPQTMPIHVSADGVTLSHLVIRGVGPTARQRAYCRSPGRRPLGGGIRVSASDFTLRNSVVRDLACYTALEVTSGARRSAVRGNVIGPNGDHRPGEIWADGVTIHDAEAAVVAGNLFIDNTDVQLILGGCRGCRIENNRFRHSGPFSRASFAELMLHGWPTTSGDYAGTLVRGNDIDCGVNRRCGYGIMIGAAPWYQAATAGGTILGNRVSNAMVALNVDGLTGSVKLRGNAVRASGGRYRSACGVRDWPAANVAPASRRFVMGDPSDATEGSVSTAGCLLNRREP